MKIRATDTRHPSPWPSNKTQMTSLVYNNSSQLSYMWFKNYIFCLPLNSLISVHIIPGTGSLWEAQWGCTELAHWSDLTAAAANHQILLLNTMVLHYGQKRHDVVFANIKIVTQRKGRWSTVVFKVMSPIGTQLLYVTFFLSKSITTVRSVFSNGFLESQMLPYLSGKYFFF